MSALPVLTCHRALQGHVQTPCVLVDIRIIEGKNPTNGSTPEMRLLDTLLEGQGPEVLEFVDELLERKNGLLDYRVQQASFTDMALWGVDADQWSLAKRAVAVQRLHERLTAAFPYVTLSHQKGLQATTSGQWFCIEAGERLRPMVITTWLGRDVDLIDEMTFSQMVQALPKGWTLILQGRRTTPHTIASTAGRRVEQ